MFMENDRQEEIGNAGIAWACRRWGRAWLENWEERKMDRVENLLEVERMGERNLL